LRIGLGIKRTSHGYVVMPEAGTLFPTLLGCHPVPVNPLGLTDILDLDHGRMVARHGFGKRSLRFPEERPEHPARRIRARGAYNLKADLGRKEWVPAGGWVGVE
jgi:hypothetical protein